MGSSISLSDYTPPPIIDEYNRLADKFDIKGVTGKVLLEASSNCAVKAIITISRSYNYDTSLFERLVKNDKSFFMYFIDRINSEGLGLKDIIDIMRITINKGEQYSQVPDLRYNSNFRDVDGIVFRTAHKGIAAIKFKKGNSSHWIPFGDQTPWYYSIERLKKRYPGFDGIGHTVVFRPSVDIEAMKNTHSSQCQNVNCNLCCRNTFCFERRK
jgi:hypothetical protein